MTFTSRDLLWLMVVVELALGWWLERRHLIYRAERYLRSYDSAIIAIEGFADEPAFFGTGMQRIAPSLPKELRDEIDQAKKRKAARGG